MMIAIKFAVIAQEEDPEVLGQGHMAGLNKVWKD